MKSIFEQMGGTYRREGDYLIPNLVLEKDKSASYGKYGMLRESYLKTWHRGLYAGMRNTGKLKAHLLEVDRQASERVERLTKRMAAAEGVTEEFKAENQMLWAQRMNNIRNRAEEIVLNEIVYG